MRITRIQVTVGSTHICECTQLHPSGEEYPASFQLSACNPPQQAVHKRTAADPQWAVLWHLITPPTVSEGEGAATGRAAYGHCNVRSAPGHPASPSDAGLSHTAAGSTQALRRRSALLHEALC